jgi:hypothetical protein
MKGYLSKRNRHMDIYFVGGNKFKVIYIDGMIVSSKSDEDQLKNLRQTFIKCRRFGLSLVIPQF